MFKKGIIIIIRQMCLCCLLFCTGVVYAAKSLEFLSASERTWLQNHQMVRLGIDPAWKPFEYVNEQGQYDGMAAAYVGLLNDLLGISMQPVANLSWKQVIEKMKQGELDILPCVVKTPQREDYMRFTQVYLDFPMVVLTRDDAPFVSSLDALTGETVGVVEGYASYDLLKLNHPGLDLRTFKTLEEGLDKLSSGRINIFVDNLASVTQVIRDNGLTNVRVAASTPYSFKLRIGVRKDWPEMVSILNKALKQLTDQQKNTIQNKWITIQFDHGVSLGQVLLVVFFVLGIIVIVTLFLLYRQRTLTAELSEQSMANLIGKISVALETSQGEAFFRILSRELATALEADFALIGHYHKGTESIDAFAVYGDGEFLPEFEYQLKNSPCEKTMKNNVCVITSDVVSNFPDDAMLQKLMVESYTGIRLDDSAGNALGLIVVLSRKPIKDPEMAENLIRIFAVHVSAEIERHYQAQEFRKLSQAIEFSPNAVVITDDKGIVEYVNPCFTKITGYEPVEVIGQLHQMLDPDVIPYEEHLEVMYKLHSGRPWTGEKNIQKKNGDYYWATESIAPIIDSQGVVTHFVVIQQDVTDAHKASEKISYQATHDSLTDLINRSEFERRLQETVKNAIREGHRHALCFLDLDQFKVVNDSLGHVAGDELLRQLGDLLKGHLREGDTLARLGGDEFAILMSNCSLKQAHLKADEIRELIRDFQFVWQNRQFAVGVSIGIASIDETVHNATEVLKHADIACYAAKDSGRNRIRVYESEDESVMARSGEIKWTSLIAKALENDRFRLYAQVIKPTDINVDFVHYEVLLRMLDDNDRILPPGAFMAAAERYHLMTRIDQWVIDHVFDWLELHASQFPEETHFSVNLSGHSMVDEDLLQHLMGLLQTGRVAPDRLQFEVTETAAITNLRSANNFISTVKTEGCSFSLDDFGSGLSSFGYLKNLDVDVLKIDGMFVKDILDDPTDAAMVKSINEIGQVMGMETIAEFVENEAIAIKLFEMGVNYVQGYGIGRPIPIDELLT